MCLQSSLALSIPLDTAATFSAGFPYEYKRGQPVTLMARGSGTNAMYIMEVDPTTGAIPIGGTVTANNSSVSATGAAVPASATYIAGKNAGNLVGVAVSAGGVVSVDGSAVTQPVSAASLPLPTGASTSALQTTGNTSLSSIDTKTPALVSGRVPVDGSGVTQPVSAASLPLPTGASTAAKQPALGTAGTASADVITVQGIASMTALKTDGSATTQPVSGTVAVSNFPATQPVSGTVTANQGGAPWTVTGTGTAGTAATGVLTVQGIASMTAVKTDGSGVTQPISAASLPLPSGASTAVKQPALGTAGTASADVITVQGIASMTALKTDSSATTQPVSGTVTSNQGGAPWTVTGTGTAGTAATGVMTVQGITSMTALKVDGSAVTQPVSGTVTVNPLTNSSIVKAQLQTDGGSAISFGAATAANSLPVTIASNQATFPVRDGNSTGDYDSNVGAASAQTLRTTDAGRSLTTTTVATYDYTGGTVTTAAYTQVIASTTNAINRLYVFDSSGSAIILATGAAASEVNRLYIPPGGQPSVYELNIPASTRISIKALDTNASVGRLILTGLN